MPARPERLTLIAAVAANGVIGHQGRLPWHLPEDLRHFRELTLDQAVIMGRKTWESLPEKFRPLPQRRNIVVTRNPDYAAAGAVVAHTLAAALEACGEAVAYVIGGAELYRQALPLADRLELTEIAATYEGDAKFPALDKTLWQEVARQTLRAKSGLAFAFVTYQRRNKP